ncbi:hypothetical protein IIA15_08520 [candidate division TA06 bacterium]|nr:hypothetical protein [candidate division TA06 bacterium]
MAYGEGLRSCFLFCEILIIIPQFLFTIHPTHSARAEIHLSFPINHFTISSNSY